MKNLVMIFSLLGFGSMANAGQIVCSGSYSGYDFVVQAKTSGRAVTGKVTIQVSSANKVVKKSTLTVTSSDLRPNQSLAFSAQGADGSGTIRATFQNGSYTGTMDAQTEIGGASLPVVCKVTGVAIVNGFAYDL